MRSELHITTINNKARLSININQLQYIAWIYEVRIIYLWIYMPDFRP